MPTLSVCALARRHVTVAISGDGGDEVFAGYRRHLWHRLTEAVRSHLPPGLRTHAIGRLATVYPKLDRAPRWLRAKHTLTEISLDATLGYYRMLAKTQDDRRRALYAPSFEVGIDGHDPARHVTDLMREAGSDDPLVQAQYTDLNLYLASDILTKVDRASMACSLEVRAPFLDPDMVAFGMSLPSGLKIRGRHGKHVLKQALAQHLPHDILFRRKQGFAASLAGLFRAEHDQVHSRLMGAPMLESGIFSAQTLAQLTEEHRGGQFDHNSTLWQLLVFEGFLASHGPSSESEKDYAGAGDAYA